jgi:hypothetical protein
MPKESNHAPRNANVTDAGLPDADAAKYTAYEIGYGRPPKATQFKKGQSGNPRGSKKKIEVDDLRTVIEGVLAEPIKVRDGKKTRTVSKLEAMMLAQRLSALKGDQKAVKALFKLAQKTGSFSQARPKGFMVLDPAGDAEEQMILEAYHAAQNNSPSFKTE